MKTELRKVYECEHCGKTMLSAGAMGYHEQWCKKNPKNKHKCFKLCRYLKRNIDVQWADEEGNGVYKFNFICMKTGRQMYSFHLEKRKKYSFRKLPIDAIRMPLECSLFQEMNLDEQDQRFGR
jgi:hypothetical protein